MRQTIIDLITDTIIHVYDLPHSSTGLGKTVYTTEVDKCYKAADINKVAEIIYNSIVHYSYNEFELQDKDLQSMHAAALKTKLKYNPAAEETVKIKYGFFGEVLLYSILLLTHKARPIIARGYFYNPLENSETKGYDSYQLVDNGGNTELWFGEVKFHIDYKQAIDSVMSNIEKALSDDYLETNILAMSNHKNNFNINTSPIGKIIEDWEADPEIKICDEIAKHNMTLIYPIFILYQYDDENYEGNIKKISDYITTKHHSKSFTISTPYKLFFILLPLEKVKEIKANVISWIESKKPLI